MKGKRKKERRGEGKGAENEIMVGDVERDGIEERGRGGKGRGGVDGKNFSKQKFDNGAGKLGEK